MIRIDPKRGFAWRRSGDHRVRPPGRHHEQDANQAAQSALTGEDPMHDQILRTRMAAHRKLGLTLALAAALSSGPGARDGRRLWRSIGRRDGRGAPASRARDRRHDRADDQRDRGCHRPDDGHDYRCRRAASPPAAPARRRASRPAAPAWRPALRRGHRRHNRPHDWRGDNRSHDR